MQIHFDFDPQFHKHVLLFLVLGRYLSRGRLCDLLLGREGEIRELLLHLLFLKYFQLKITNMPKCHFEVACYKPLHQVLGETVYLSKDIESSSSNWLRNSIDSNHTLEGKGLRSVSHRRFSQKEMKSVAESVQDIPKPKAEYRSLKYLVTLHLKEGRAHIRKM